MSLTLHIYTKRKNNVETDLLYYDLFNIQRRTIIRLITNEKRNKLERICTSEVLHTQAFQKKWPKLQVPGPVHCAKNIL